MGGFEYFHYFCQYAAPGSDRECGLVVLGSMAGYWISRYPGKFHGILFGILIAAMAIPFETVMIPLVKVATNIHMVHSISKLGICYWGMGASTYVFMVCGAVKAVPVELEESAYMDGYGPFRTFWKIVFPLLKSTTVTMVIINTFWVWNDYLMPQLLLEAKNSCRLSVVHAVIVSGILFHVGHRSGRSCDFTDSYGMPVSFRTALYYFGNYSWCHERVKGRR